MGLLESQKEALLAVGMVVVRSFAVIVLAALGVRLGDSLIEKLFQEASEMKGAHLSDNRAKTLKSLLKSSLRYVAFAIACLTILEVAGIDTKALLGGAAILGLAVGFGAQMSASTMWVTT